MSRAPYVYEFDLDGFFDNVSHAGIEKKLMGFGVPRERVDLILRLCRNVPKMGKHSDDLLDEPDRSVELLPDGSPNPAYVPGLGSSTRYKLKGVPQGAAFSCGVSILCNLETSRYREFVTPTGEKGWLVVVNYADDGIIFSSHPINPGEVVDSPFFGVAHKPVKSRGIRGYGPEVAMKFLGLVRQVDGRIVSESRSGASLELCDSALSEWWGRTW